MASAWLLRLMIMSVLYSLQHLMEHCHLHRESIARFVLHEAARTVKHFVSHGSIASDWQTVHEATVRARGREPGLAHAPVSERTPQLRIRIGIAVGRGRAPLLGVDNMRARERFGALARFAHRAAGKRRG